MSSVFAHSRAQPPPRAHTGQRPRKPTAAQLRQLDAELRAERARLDRSLHGAGAWEGTRESRAGDRDSVAPGDTDGGLRVALLSRAHARRDAIDAALQRLADGTFGSCIACDEPIPFGRLIVMPESACCLTCGPGV